MDDAKWSRALHHDLNHMTSQLEEWTEIYGNAARYWARLHLMLGLPSVVFSAIAGASSLGQFDYHNYVAGILAIVVATLTALTTFLNPSQKSALYAETSKKYQALSNRISTFARYEMVDLDQSGARKRIVAFYEEADKLNEITPLLSVVRPTRGATE